MFRKNDFCLENGVKRLVFSLLIVGVIMTMILGCFEVESDDNKDLDLDSIKIITSSLPDTLKVGDTVSIDWEVDSNLARIKIEYKTGDEWVTINDSVKNEGNYKWVIPANFDEKDVVFRISNPENLDVFALTDPIFIEAISQVVEYEIDLVGRVLDNNNQPVPRAIAQLNDRGLSDTTGSDGYYHIQLTKDQVSALKKSQYAIDTLNIIISNQIIQSTEITNFIDTLSELFIVQRDVNGKFSPNLTTQLVNQNENDLEYLVGVLYGEEIIDKRIIELGYNTTNHSFSGFIYFIHDFNEPDYFVYVTVHNSDSNEIGRSDTIQFNQKFGDLEFPEFPANNGIPRIIVNTQSDIMDTIFEVDGVTGDTTWIIKSNSKLSIRDSLFLNAEFIDLHGGTMENLEWDIDNSGYFETDNLDTIVVLPDAVSQDYSIRIRMTDDDGNRVTTSLIFSVDMQPPTVNIDSIKRIWSINDTVSLSGTAADNGTIEKWEWKITDNDYKTVGNVDTNIVLPGNYYTDYTVILRGTDDDGNSSEDTLSLEIKSHPPTAMGSAPDKVNIGDEVDLKGSSSTDTNGTIVKYEWKLGDGSWEEDSDGDVMPSAPNSPQPWIVRLRVTDDDGETDEYMDTVIIESSPPIAVSTAPTNININDSVTLTGSGSTDNGTIIKYEWKLGNGSWTEDDDGDIVVPAPSTPQAWICSLRVTDEDGETGYSANTVSVESSPPQAISTAPSKINVKSDIVLVGSGSTDNGSIVKFEWKFGNDIWIEDDDGDVIVPALEVAQLWVCSLRVTDDDGEVSYSTNTVIVESSPPNAVSQAVSTILINNSFTLNGSGSTDNGSIEKYEWKIGNNNWVQVSDGDTLIQGPGIPQTILCSLRVTDNDGEKGFSREYVRIISDPPKAVIVAPDNIDINDSFSLIGSNSTDSSGSIIKYEWKIGSSTWSEDSNGDTVVQAPSTPQSLICSLRVTDHNGEIGYAAETVQVTLVPPTAKIISNKFAQLDSNLSLSGSASTDDGTIEKYEWSIGFGSWKEDSDGDTTFKVEIHMIYNNSIRCSLRVTDEDGNIGVAGINIRVESSFTDSRDGKVYRTVPIGSQIWMGNNLNFVSDTGSYCYGDSAISCANYGRLYNGGAVLAGDTSSSQVQGVCPTGWHLPSQTEWSILSQHVENESGESGSALVKHLKDKNGWRFDDPSTNLDTYGFSGLPGGHTFNSSSYDQLYFGGYWWGSTKNDSAALYGQELTSFGFSSAFTVGGTSLDLYKRSVRCIKD